MYKAFIIIYYHNFFRIKIIFNYIIAVLMLSDSQVYIALCISLLVAILAIRLGTTLYE